MRSIVRSGPTRNLNYNIGCSDVFSLCNSGSLTRHASSFFSKSFLCVSFIFFSLFSSTRPDRRRPLTGAPVNQYGEPRGLRENVQHTVYARLTCSNDTHLQSTYWEVQFWNFGKRVVKCHSSISTPPPPPPPPSTNNVNNFFFMLRKLFTSNRVWRIFRFCNEYRPNMYQFNDIFKQKKKEIKIVHNPR